MPLARYALIADGEQIHSAMHPGSIFGPLFTEQTEANVRSMPSNPPASSSARRRGSTPISRPRS